MLKNKLYFFKHPEKKKERFYLNSIYPAAKMRISKLWKDLSRLWLKLHLLVRPNELKAGVAKVAEGGENIIM